MSRGVVPDLAVAHPLGLLLPALLQEDDFAQRLTAALDEVLAPAPGALDSLAAYVDPWLAPPDFLEWLAGWVGLLIDETWTLEQQRRFVSDAVALYQWRGTARGLAELVSIYTGVTPEIVESGASGWSPTPGGSVPGRPEPSLTVRVAVPDPGAVDTRRLTAIVAAAVPAHIPYRVEVTKA